ncbi:carbon-nitrogen hydrolase family protein [Saccharothrix sp. ALI-22-I]|uniref:carbon-nitrogen hydrolase family protein n=1 Tax=Saccharothrix sp. ALI-22-I TaxID=1933778 RepID=UPI00097C6CF4|nr:carbon-nitrogen hydrolase family protein [Saccharothrix sp. ALI-22-I]ONI84574.1 carbon-nitrogen hydrolase family protein [Saccharothrix sp. ALI-22-I]
MFTLAVAQPRCTPYDVAANVAAHASAVRAAGARVVVFPELSLTGYHFDAPVVPFDLVEPLVQACAETGTVAFAGAPVQGPHIGVLEVSGAGVRVAYRKMWLGGGEPVRFRPGDAPAVVEVDGVRLGLAVCKDTGVPQHAADTAALGIDVYVAGVLEHAWDSAVVDERARRIAVEHGVWVAVASFAGSTGEGYASAAGRSAVWDSSGRMVVSADTSVDSVVRAVIPARATR